MKQLQSLVPHASLLASLVTTTKATNSKGEEYDKMTASRELTPTERKAIRKTLMADEFDSIITGEMTAEEAFAPSAEYRTAIELRKKFEAAEKNFPIACQQFVVRVATGGKKADKQAAEELLKNSPEVLKKASDAAFVGLPTIEHASAVRLCDDSFSTVVKDGKETQVKKPGILTCLARASQGDVYLSGPYKQFVEAMKPKTSK